MTLPNMVRVRQSFPPTPAVDIESTLRAEFDKLRPQLKPGARIAVAAGSRGITAIARIVSTLVALLKDAGARPFLIPAMGSHGGATPAGQTAVLADYGITPDSAGAEIRASMDVLQLGTTANQSPVLWSREAMDSDGVIVVNRVKPHTDFQGNLGSGLIKMLVIGLGKHQGAAAAHRAASWLGYEHALRAAARLVLAKAPVLGGLAIVENQSHQTARLELVLPPDLEHREGELLTQARALMPSLPFDEIDLLIVDQIGKNISGAGMDPNVTGRWVHGYSTELARGDRPKPFVRRIFVRGLTPETHGNAIGIGAADFTTSRLVAALDPQSTYVNTLTALTPNGAKIPMHFKTDSEVIRHAIGSVALNQPTQAAIVRIKDTLSLDRLEVSEPLLAATGPVPGLETLSAPAPWQFDPNGDLTSMESTASPN